MKQPTQWNADGELYYQVYPNDISEFPWKKGRLYPDVSKNFPCKFAPVVVRGLDLLDGTPVLDIKPYVRNSAEPGCRCGELKVGQGQIDPQRSAYFFGNFGGIFATFCQAPNNKCEFQRRYISEKTSLV